MLGRGCCSWLPLPTLGCGAWLRGWRLQRMPRPACCMNNGPRRNCRFVFGHPARFFACCDPTPCCAAILCGPATRRTQPADALHTLLRSACCKGGGDGALACCADSGSSLCLQAHIALSLHPPWMDAGVAGTTRVVSTPTACPWSSGTAAGGIVCPVTATCPIGQIGLGESVVLRCALLS